jgi:type I restriction enzyme S subunit
MAGEWSDKPLLELCSYINRGSAPAYIEAGGVLVLNQKCVRDQRVSFLEARRTDQERKPVIGDRMLQLLDILVNSTGVGTLGRVAQLVALPEPATVDSHVTIVRPDPAAVDPRYLGFAVRLYEREIEALAEGSTGQTELSRARLGAFQVPLAPEKEQRAIAHILGTLDDKIELNRRMNETLEAMARALFKSWFVDFDPVRAKAAGRDPGLPKPLADLFPDSFDDSELREIPKGWKVAPLSDCVDVARGLSYKGSGLSSSEDGVPMHNLNSIYEGGGYKHDGLKHYQGEYKPQHVACAGDLIVANTEQGHHRLLIGYAAIVPARFGGQSLFSHHLYRVRTKSSSGLTADYLCHLLNTSVIHETVSGYANGTTVNMLPMDGLQTPQVLVPPSRVVIAFNDIAETARKRHEEMVEEGRTLAALRDTLLPKLIAGELRVQDAERFVGRAT